MHRTILVVDVAGFGDQQRTNPQQVVVRDGVYRALQEAFSGVGIPWANCDCEDRGDGLFVLAPPDVPKCRFVEELPDALVGTLHRHNNTHYAEERIQLRMAVHAGEVIYDNHGVTGSSVNLAFRLVDAQPLKAALADSSGALAVIVSSWFFDEVVRHSPASKPANYRPIPVIVKETDTTGWICLPGQPYPPSKPASQPTDLVEPTRRVVPAQLPLDVYGFAGRSEQLERLDELLASAAEQPTAVVISAVSGTAGVGKTALAVHWAHRVRWKFSDGQLYVNLRGFDPGGQLTPPSEALRGFLNALGVPADKVPPGLDAQAALYRSLLDGRRVLVVLDNARDANQVRPLLPSTPTALVLVTSRNQLTSLVAVDGAHPVALDVLSLDEARELLARRLGAGRVSAEPESVKEIINQCARLPLALAIAAARLAQSGFSIAALAAELAHTSLRLDALNAGDSLTEMRTVFSWSYDALTPAAAELFRLLGLDTGPDISIAAATSVAGLPLPKTRLLLIELTQASLLIERTPGRYAMHDLLRRYAADLAKDGLNDQHADAIIRLLDHYLHTAHTAAQLLHPNRDPITIALAPATRGVTPEQLTDHRQAMAWLTDEHVVLLAAARQAADAGFDTHAWQLAWTLDTFLDRRGHWLDLADAWQNGLDAAGRLEHPIAQAYAHRCLARVYARLGHRHDAYTHQRRALDLYAQAGDSTGRAATHHDLADLLGQQGRPNEAVVHAEQALILYRAAGHRRGQALLLNEIGRFQSLLGNHRQGLASCQQALTLFEELADREGQALTRINLGHAYHYLGHYIHAVNCYEQALELCRNLGDRYEEAVTLTHLGETHHTVRNPAAARTSWQLALEIVADLDHPDADRIRAKLRALDHATANRTDQRGNAWLSAPFEDDA